MLPLVCNRKVKNWASLPSNQIRKNTSKATEAPKKIEAKGLVKNSLTERKGLKKLSMEIYLVLCDLFLILIITTGREKF